MSGLLMGKAFYFELPPRQKLLLLAIADHANDDGFGSHPSQIRLAQKVGCTRRHIHNLLKELEGMGLVEVLEPGDGAGYTARYYLPWALAVGVGKGGNIQQKAEVQSSHEPSLDPSASSEVDPNGSSSSSAGKEEDEDSYMGRLPAFYKQVQSSPLFLSAVPAPGPYFRKLRAKGDVPPIADLVACWRVGERLHEALAEGLEAQGRPLQPLTVPGPTLLPGLALCWEPLQRYDLQPRWIRLALGIFCEGDGRIQRVEAAEILERIAKRSDLFAEALHQQSERLG